MQFPNWLRVCWWCSPHSTLLQRMVHYIQISIKTKRVHNSGPYFSILFPLFQSGGMTISSKSSAESAEHPWDSRTPVPTLWSYGSKGLRKSRFINCAWGFTVSPRSPSQDDPSGKAPSMRPHASSSLLSIRPHLFICHIPVFGGLERS